MTHATFPALAAAIVLVLAACAAVEPALEDPIHRRDRT